MITTPFFRSLTMERKVRGNGRQRLWDASEWDGEDKREK